MDIVSRIFNECLQRISASISWALRKNAGDEHLPKTRWSACIFQFYELPVMLIMSSISEPFNGRSRRRTEAPFMGKKKLHRLSRDDYTRCISVAVWRMHKIYAMHQRSAFFQYCCVVSEECREWTFHLPRTYTRRSVETIVIHLLVNYVTSISWSRDVLVLRTARCVFYVLATQNFSVRSKLTKLERAIMLILIISNNRYYWCMKIVFLLNMSDHQNKMHYHSTCCKMRN